MYDQAAAYYDQLYAGKDYKAECQFLEETCRLAKQPVESVIDVGCGTGGHAACLKEMGYRPWGFDLSAGMIEQGKKKHPDLDLEVADARTLETDSIFDAAISMFGTMTYFPEPKDFSQVLERLHRSLRPGGLFIFDGWNAHAVSKAQAPNGRLEKFGERLFKYTEMTPETDTVANFTFTILDLNEGNEMSSTTPLLLFTKEMVGELLDQNGFDLLFYWKAFSPETEPTDEDWKVSVVARRCP